MIDELAHNAVKLALKGDWSQAIKVNLSILKENPEDVEALNRLARAYAENGDIKKARATAQKSIKIDPLNQIAFKCLEKWKTLKNISPKKADSLNENFLEEPGKTKMISLINLGENDVISSLDSGDSVFLLPHPHRVSVVTSENEYIGRLPDDLAARVRKLIAGGNKYMLIIKSADKNEVKIFIREISQGKTYKNMSSF